MFGVIDFNIVFHAAPSSDPDVTVRNCNDVMIDNIDAWLKGRPINIIEGCR